MIFDANVWGPHYWFFLHTIAHSYPPVANEVTKRKYYDTIQNMPLFIPNEDIGNHFQELLDKYPVSPYLDKRESFIRWVIFIHNKINAQLGKEELTFDEAMERYTAHYKPRPIYLAEKLHIKKHYLYAVCILIMIFIVYMYYT
jgi:hypothetical protein